MTRYADIPKLIRSGILRALFTSGVTNTLSQYRAGAV